MGGIRFFTKTETDGRRRWRIEGDDSATPDEIGAAIEKLWEWLIEAERSPFYHVTTPEQFVDLVRRLSKRGYSKKEIAIMANAEMIRLLAYHLAEMPPKGTYSESDAAYMIVASFRAAKWLQQADLLLSSARPAWGPEKRREEIEDAIETMLSGEAPDREALIDRDTVKRTLKRKS